MNFALNISNKIEKILQTMIDRRMAEKQTDMIDEYEEEEMYQAALEQVLAQDKRAWAKGNIRVGDLILIVDSDTRVV